MTYPGPPGDPDERPLDAPDLGMGVPESGTQHATSTDYPLPLDRPADPDVDPLLVTGGASDSLAGASSLSQPTPPTYDAAADLVQPAEPTTTVPADDSYGRHAYPDEAGGGILDKVKAFADQRPELFLGVTLLVGWLVGRLFSSSDDSDE